MESGLTQHAFADLPLKERVAQLIAFTRFGRIHPTWGVIQDGAGKLRCECRNEPCRGGKHPRLSRWPEKATTEPKVIRRWAKRYPAANWALVTGESVDVIDLDRKPGGPDGVAEFNALEMIACQKSPTSIRTETGSGRQIWFAHDPQGRITTAAGRLPGIDTRGPGGYVMLPGSRHMTGRIYSFVPAAGPSDSELSYCPDWLIQRIGPPSGAPVIAELQPGSAPPGSAPRPLSCVLGIVTSPRWGDGLRLGNAGFLSPEQGERIGVLCNKSPKFRATWHRDRSPSSALPFPSLQDSASEYEGSIAFYLAADRWEPQAMLDALFSWRRKHGLPLKMNLRRYETTIGKALQTVHWKIADPRPLKGAWKHRATKLRLLQCVADRGPQTPSDVAARFPDLNKKHIMVVLGRLHKAGLLDRQDGTYKVSRWGLYELANYVDSGYYQREEMTLAELLQLEQSTDYENTEWGERT